MAKSLEERVAIASLEWDSYPGWVKEGSKWVGGECDRLSEDDSPHHPSEYFINDGD